MSRDLYEGREGAVQIPERVAFLVGPKYKGPEMRVYIFNEKGSRAGVGGESLQ